MVWKSLVAAVCAFGVGSLAALYAAGPPLGSGAAEKIAVSATPIALNRSDPAVTQVGKLRYLGGLELRSGDRRFGGISGLLWEPACERLLAVTDTGAWIVLQPEEQGDRLTGMAAVWIAPLLDSAGEAPRSKVEADAESLGRGDKGGDETFVWFEQDHRAQRYRGISACLPESLGAPASIVSRPPGIAGWPRNGGAEATGMLGETVVLLSEGLAGPGGGRSAVRWTPSSGDSETFSFMAPDNFDPTDMAARNPGDPNGPMLVLLRRFSPLTGAAAMLVEADFAGAGAAVTPKPLAVLQPPLAVDNMEGLAVRAEGKRRFVYLVSDDNFNALQRTILLKFELVE